MGWCNPHPPPTQHSQARLVTPVKHLSPGTGGLEWAGQGLGLRLEPLLTLMRSEAGSSFEKPALLGPRAPASALLCPKLASVGGPESL